MLSFSSFQAATLIVAHAVFTKALISFTLRTYQYLEWDVKRRESVESSSHLQEFQKAQTNESEYTALATATLLYLSLTGKDAVAASTLVVVGQIGYVWMRTAIGYPKLPTIAFAVVRYAGFALVVQELWSTAF